MKRKFYLAYGANTNKNAMALRCPASVFIAAYTLKEFRFVFRGVADVVDAKNSNVDVALWSITENCEAALDVFEGFPRLYVKRYATIRVEDVRQRAMFYVMRTPLSRQALPIDAYLETLLKGYADCGLDTKQIHDAIQRIHQRKERYPDLVLPQGVKPHSVRYWEQPKSTAPKVYVPEKRNGFDQRARTPIEKVRIIKPRYLRGDLPSPASKRHHWGTAMERAFQQAIDLDDREDEPT